MKKLRYLCFRRGKMYYGEDTTTGKQWSLRTRDEKRARAIIDGKNGALANPHVELAKAKAVLDTLEPLRQQRTWQPVIDLFASTGTKDSSKERKRRALAQPAFDPLRDKVISYTTAEDLLAVLNANGSMVNQYLKCLQNIAVGMGWSQTILPPKLWPPRKKLPKRRAITNDEHEKILASEKSPERRAYYEIIYETGAAQSDAANFSAMNVNWTQRRFSYVRMKTGERCTIQFGPRLEALLRSLPGEGYFFPTLQESTDKWRSAEFCRRRKVAGVSGVSLHCYRYAWAQRARAAGYPRRWAEAALGHNCPAVHDAYANDDSVVCESLESWEHKIIPLNSGQHAGADGAGAAVNF